MVILQVVPGRLHLPPLHLYGILILGPCVAVTQIDLFLQRLSIVNLIHTRFVPCERLSLSCCFILLSKNRPKLIS